MFWLKSEKFTHIESAGLDGSRRQKIFDDAVSSGRDLKIDLTTRRLYWFDETHDRICSINLDGSDLRHSLIPSNRYRHYLPIIGLELGTSRTRFLTVSAGRIYFVNDMSIMSIAESEANSSTAYVLMTLNHQPYALRVFGQEDQPARKLCFCWCYMQCLRWFANTPSNAF